MNEMKRKEMIKKMKYFHVYMKLCSVILVWIKLVIDDEDDFFFFSFCSMIERGKQ